jgi:general secretion pathway protein G
MHTAPSSRRAFTLVELLVVITIIGILGTVVAHSYVGHIWEAKAVRTREMLLEVRSALDAYMLHHGSYPSDGEGLERLTERDQRLGGLPYLRFVPVDPYGGKLIYRVVGDLEIELISLGRDQQEGTDDDIRLSDLEAGR